MWKAEACWGAQVDPWRPVREVADAEAVAVLEAIRPRMRAAAVSGPREHGGHGVYNRAGRPCRRCGALVRARGQGDDNRTTFWCPGCQS
jgi:endonuclease-8